MRIASRQMVNLWGRSNGEVDELVSLALVPDAESPIANIQIERSSRIDSIPNHADVSIIVTYNLIVMRRRLGRKVECVPSEEDENPIIRIPLQAFGDDFGKAMWQVKFTDPEEPGRVFAWTKRRMVNEGEGLLMAGDGSGSSLLRIKSERLEENLLWKLEFPIGYSPFVIVNTSNHQFFEDLKKRYSLSSMLLLPEVVGLVLDEIIVNMCQDEFEIGSEGVWQSKWLSWVDRKFEIEHPPSVSENENLAEWIRWKNDVVSQTKSRIEQSDKVANHFTGGE